MTKIEATDPRAPDRDLSNHSSLLASDRSISDRLGLPIVILCSKAIEFFEGSTKDNSDFN